MNLINRKCPCTVMDENGNEIDCPCGKADVMAIVNGEILYKCTTGIKTNKITFAHQYTLDPIDNEDWKKFFKKEAIDKLNIS